MTGRNRPRLFVVDAHGASSPGYLADMVDEVDADLLAQARAGAWEAWQQLVDRHVADVWAWSSEATASEAEGELVNQLVWLRLAQAMPSVEVLPLGPWLHRVVREEAARRRASSPRTALRAVRTTGE